MGNLFAAMLLPAILLWGIGLASSSMGCHGLRLMSGSIVVGLLFLMVFGDLLAAAVSRLIIWVVSVIAGIALLVLMIRLLRWIRQRL